MPWISRAELTSVVSNAGGLGTITAPAFPDPKDLATQIKKTRQMTKVDRSLPAKQSFRHDVAIQNTPWKHSSVKSK
jgi:NAD(P)H-dependent flavin oxidoreductase YrpB (nitropropane dioxygenase family)